MELEAEVTEQGDEQQMGGRGIAPSRGKTKRAALGVVPTNGADRPPATNPEPAKRRKLLKGGRMLQPDTSFDGASASAATAASKPAAKTAAAKKQQRNLSLFSSFVDKTNFKVPKMKGTAASARLMQQQRDARRGKK